MARKNGYWLAGAAALGLLAASVSLPAMAQDAAEWSADDAGYGEDDAYAWIDRADTLSRTIGESPPDYSFAYDSGEPWAWRLGDGSLVIAEERGDGPWSYYFDAGSDEPFLIRGPERSFGFDRSEVAVIYATDGAVLDREEGGPWLDQAEESLRRGRALHRAWQRRDERPVATAAWIDFSFLWLNLNSHWEQGRIRHPRWRRWRERHGDWSHHRRFDEEARRRALIAERFRRWRDGRFDGTPPGRWQRPPVGWRPRRPGDRPGWTRPRPDGQPGTRPPRGPRPDGEPGTRPPRGPRPDGEPGTRPPRTPRPGDGQPHTGGPQRPRAPLPAAPPLVGETPPPPAAAPAPAPTRPPRFGDRPGRREPGTRSPDRPDGMPRFRPAPPSARPERPAPSPGRFERPAPPPVRPERPAPGRFERPAPPPTMRAPAPAPAPVTRAPPPAPAARAPAPAPRAAPAPRSDSRPVTRGEGIREK